MKKLFKSYEDIVYLRNEELDESVIGKGTFSEIRLVCHRNNPSIIYALKDMQKTNEEEIVYIYKEIDIHMNLDHHHIVRFYDYIETKDSFLFFLEYCEQGDLFDYIVNENPNHDFLLQKFYELCQAIKYLHDRDIMHRDLKPENIFLDKDLNIKLGDFGWSAVYSELSVRESLCGTLYYNAYEVFAENAQTKKTDIWSLGILLFLFYHNYVPFQGQNIIQMMELLRKSEEYLSVRKDIDPNARELIKKILRFDPEKRPDIDQILQHQIFDKFKKDRHIKYQKKTDFNFDKILKKQQKAFKKDKKTSKSPNIQKDTKVSKSPIFRKNSKNSGSQYKRDSKNSGSQMKTKKRKNTITSDNNERVEKTQNKTPRKELKVKVHKSLSKKKNIFGTKFTYKGFNIYENRNENSKISRSKQKKSGTVHKINKPNPSSDKIPNIVTSIQSLFNADSSKKPIQTKQNFWTNNNTQNIYQPTVMNEYYNNETYYKDQNARFGSTKKNVNNVNNRGSTSKGESKERKTTGIRSFRNQQTDIQKYLNEENTKIRPSSKTIVSRKNSKQAQQRKRNILKKFEKFSEQQNQKNKSKSQIKNRQNNIIKMKESFNPKFDHLQKLKKKAHQLKSTEKETIEKLDQKIKDAKENFGDLEIRNALCEKAEYLLDKENYDESKKLYNEALEKTAGGEKKLDIHLQLLYLYYKQKNYTEYQKELQVCLQLNEDSGDWEKKNKLAVYEGIMMIIQRNFPRAAELFLGCVNTFNAPEVISFDTLVYYGCILGFLVLDRLKIKEQIINNSEIQSVLREDPVIFNFVDSIYQSEYNKYFENLITLCENFISKDEFLKPHQEYIIKNSKIRIFSQYLKSFQTVTLDKMGNDFSVDKEFIDEQLSQFIANGHLKCQIDKVNGVVSSSKEDPRLELHKEIIRRGDALIARMHNLIRIANI